MCDIPLDPDDRGQSGTVVGLHFADRKKVLLAFECEKSMFFPILGGNPYFFALENHFFGICEFFP
jgi:hypothetical protein